MSAAIWLTGPAHSSRTLTTRIAVLPNAETSGLGRRFFFPWEEMAMAKINGLCVGESLVGEGNEVAHIDLIMGPRGSAAELAFTHALTNNKDGFTSLLAVVAPNLLCKPPTDPVQQGDDQRCEAGRANVRPGSARGGQGGRRQRRGRHHSRKTKPTTCSFASAYSSIGKRPTTRRSRNTIIGHQGIDRARRQRRAEGSEVVAKRDQVKHPFAA